MNMRITLIVFALFGLTVHSDGVAQTNTPGQVRLTGLLVNQRVAEYFGEVYTGHLSKTSYSFKVNPSPTE
jgi:hypothetical protein